MGFLSFNQQKIILFHSNDSFEIKALEEKVSAGKVRLINLAKEPILPIIWQEIEAALRDKIYIKEQDIVAVDKNSVSILNGINALESFLATKNQFSKSTNKTLEASYSEIA